MKCSNCNAEIKLGSVYCEVCGKPAQIVSDYNILEDDMIEALLDEKKKKEQEELRKENERKQRELEKQKEIELKKQKAKKKKILCIVGGAVILTALVLTLYFTQTSYAHYVNKGLEADKREDYETATAYYEKAMQKDGEKVKAKLLAANDYAKQNDFARAEALYTEVISQENANTSAYKGLVLLYLSVGDYDAINELREGVTNKKVLAVFEKYLIPTPVFSEEGGEFTDDVTLLLSCDEGNEIYYSNDGTDPTAKGKGTLYQEGITLTEGTTTIKAACKNAEGNFSEVISQKYKITYETPEFPAIQPANGGTFHTPTMITIEVPEGGRVFYAWDEEKPTEASACYSEPIPMMEGNHILSLIYIDKHGKASDVMQCNYKYIPE